MIDPLHYRVNRKTIFFEGLLTVKNHNIPDISIFSMVRKRDIFFILVHMVNVQKCIYLIFEKKSYNYLIILSNLILEKVFLSGRPEENRYVILRDQL